MLVPMYFLIGIWGGQRRIYAAVKFFLYTHGRQPADAGRDPLPGRRRTSQRRPAHRPSTCDGSTTSTLTPATQRWLFAAFALAFAIKVPMFPFHTWLPDAHVEAPTGGSVILAGVLLKIGHLRLPALRAAAVPERHGGGDARSCSALAVIGIIYGALVAMVQPDLKKLVAYSSVSPPRLRHARALRASTSTGVAGAIYQMLNHGLSTGALFLLVGMIYERRHTRQIAEFGGLWKPMPRLRGASS